MTDKDPIETQRPSWKLFLVTALVCTLFLYVLPQFWLQRPIKMEKMAVMGVSYGLVAVTLPYAMQTI